MANDTTSFIDIQDKERLNKIGIVVEKHLPPGIWDNPTPGEQQAYQEFLLVWDADDSKYENHFKKWLSVNKDQTVRGLAYGSDCTSVHDGVSSRDSICDGLVLAWSFDDTDHPYQDCISGRDGTATDVIVSSGEADFDSTSKLSLSNFARSSSNGLTVYLNGVFGTQPNNGTTLLTLTGSDGGSFTMHWQPDWLGEGVGRWLITSGPTSFTLSDFATSGSGPGVLDGHVIRIDSSGTISFQTSSSLDCTTGWGTGPYYNLSIEFGDFVIGQPANWNFIAVWNRCLSNDELASLDSTLCLDCCQVCPHTGALVGGEAKLDIWEVMSGGVRVGGESDETFHDYVEGNGVVVLGGSSTVAMQDQCIDATSENCVAEGLVALWEFDDTADPYKDSIDSHDGTVGNPGYEPTPVSGLLNLSLQLEPDTETSTAEMLAVPDHTDLRVQSGDFTIAFWFLRDPADTTYSWTYIQKNQNDSEEYKIRWDGTKFHLWVDTSVQYVNSSYTSPDWSKWHLVVARKYTTYIDQLANTVLSINVRSEDGAYSDCASYEAWSAPVQSYDDLYIGNAGDYFDQFVGLMDEIAIWNRCLSDEEVDWLWGDGTAAEGRYLSNYYPCDYVIEGGVVVGGSASVQVDEHEVHNIDVGIHVAFPIPKKTAQNRKPFTEPDVLSPQNSDLLVWWNGSYPGGKILYDLAQGYDATLQNMDPDTDWSVDPERGHVLTFDGTSHWLKVPNSADLDLGASTITVWVKPAGDANGNTGIVTKSDQYSLPEGPDLPFGVGMVSGTTKARAFVVDAGLWKTVDSVNEMPVGEWTFIAATLNPNLGPAPQAITLYLNGVYESSTAITSIDTNDYNYVIGAFGNGTAEELFFEGQLDEIRIYNRVLTPQEIQQLYNAQTRYDLWHEFEVSDLVIIITPIGVVGGGEADVQYVPGDYTPEGGVFVNGIATHIHVQQEIASSGVFVNGIATHIHVQQEIASSGVKVNSTAVEDFFDYEDMDGGVVLGGQADEFITGSYDEYMDGGVVAGGDALVPDGVRITQIESEIVYYDSRIRITNISPEITYVNGRLRLTQIAAEVVYSAPLGGAVIGGEAQESLEGTYNEIMDGGVLVDGTSVVEGVYNEVTGGGVLVDGTAIVDAFYNGDMDGGVLVNGAAEVGGNTTYDETMDGSVLVGGAAIATNDEIMDGGVKLGGEAELNPLGVLVGGGADYFAIYDPTIGENEWHFFARYNQVSDYELWEHDYPGPTDNVVDCYIHLDDINNILYWRLEATFPEAYDTVRFRGPAEYGERAYTQILIDDPQPVENGSQSVTVAQVNEIKSGLWYVFVRHWTQDEGFMLMRGQIVNEPVDLGGAADESHTVDLEFGGVSLGGEARHEISGVGVVAGGIAEVTEDGEYYDVMEGGARVGGSAFQNYFEEGKNGAKVGGSAWVSYWENTCACVPASRVLSLNELNYLDQRIFLLELLDKTESLGIVWSSVRVLVQFKAVQIPFEYHLTQTQFGITLDIMKDGKFYGNFSSRIHPIVQTIFDEVAVMVKNDRRLLDTLSTHWNNNWGC